MRSQYLSPNKIFYLLLFVTLVLLGGFGFTAQDVAAVPQLDGTVPPPGGTISGAANVNFVHLAPFDTDTSITVAISNTSSLLQFNNISIGDATGYLSLPKGASQFTVMPSGNVTPTIDSLLNFADKTDYSVVAIGGSNGNPLEFLQLTDSTARPPSRAGKVRIVHVAPFATAPDPGAIKVINQDGSPVDAAFNSLKYKDSTAFHTLPVGQYDWKVEKADGSAYVDLAPFNLFDGAVLTLYIIGDQVNQAPSSVLVINRGGSYLTFIPMVARESTLP